MIDALLIYPRLGSMDSMIVELPLSIIYAATEAHAQGRNLQLVDLRTDKRDFRAILAPYLDQGVLLVGLSVMTGNPLVNAREVSKYIRENYPKVKIVWGGPHVTVLPETMAEPYLDFLVRGYGSHPLAQLIEALKTGEIPLESIQGLSWRRPDGEVVHNPRSDAFERLNFREIPYDLVEVNSPVYRRIYKGEAQRLFSIMTTAGCPYKCTFCVSPTLYEVIKGKRWVGDPEEEVVEHIQMLIDKYGATHISIIDDTSFVQLKRVRRILELILERNIKITLEFRGARINEVDKMDDDFLDLMSRVGVRVLQIGVETMSQRLLDAFEKNIDKEQILRVNRKLARHPEIVAYYNFFYGAPGETYEDLLETKNGVLQLLKENPNAYFGFGGDWKPVPGSKMLEVAVRDYQYKAPATLDEWILVDSSDAAQKIHHPWYTRKQNNLIKLMQLASFVIDDKIIRESRGNNSPRFILFRLMSNLYKPIALFRMNFDFYSMMLEYELYRLIIRLFSFLATRNAGAG